MSIFPHNFPRRGEIYWVDYGETQGSEQAGHRPAVVVSNDINNQHSSVVIVAAVTRTLPRKPYPHVVRVPAGEFPDDSTILCNQLSTLDKGRLQRYQGSLDETQLRAVARALAVSLGIP